MDAPGQPPDKPRRTTRQRALSALKVVITTLGLYLVWRGLEPRSLLTTLRTVQWVWMVAGALLIGLSLVVRAYRWHVVLAGVALSVRFTRLVELYLVGSFFNAFLPSGLGGDVVRAAEASQDVEPGVAAGTVIVDRLTGLMALFAMALMVLPFRPADFPARLAGFIGGICIVGLGSGLALLDGRPLRAITGYLPARLRAAGNGFLDRLATTIHALGWRPEIAALLVSVVFNLMQVAWWWTTGRALSLDVPYSYYLLVVPVMSLALLVPSIGGLGVRESLAPALFAGAGVRPEQAVALTLLVFGLERIASLLGAPVYVYGALGGGRRTKDGPTGRDYEPRAALKGATTHEERP